MSGLCCGALLAQKGKKVLLIEKHFKPGGYTHTFKRNEYEWDVGIHYIGDVHNKNNASIDFKTNNIREDYKFTSKLGSGAYGVVY